MHSKTIMRAIAIGMTALLVGCAKEYVYAPPATAVGQRCVLQCERSQMRCLGRVQTPKPLYHPRRRYHTSRQRACGTTFHACYRQCGGVVKVRW